MLVHSALSHKRQIPKQTHLLLYYEFEFRTNGQRVLAVSDHWRVSRNLRDWYNSFLPESRHFDGVRCAKGDGGAGEPFQHVDKCFSDKV